jgi:hypothetical protein
VGWTGDVVNRHRRHIVIPDTQLKPGVPMEHLPWLGKYIVEKKPDVIVLLGDWADMPSLSLHDINTKDAEGRTYRDDILAANDGLQMLMAPIKAEMERCERRHLRRWKPRLVVTLGNHEYRINRAVQKDRKWEGKVSTDDIFFKQWGFEVYPFLEPVNVDGVVYCHYQISGKRGWPITTAKALLTKKHQSCIVGHQQGLDFATDYCGDGSRITGVIAGSCYLHDEAYMGPQGNKHFRGFLVLNEVDNGSFDLMPVSLDYLRRKYGKAETQAQA